MIPKLTSEEWERLPPEKRSRLHAHLKVIHPKEGLAAFIRRVSPTRPPPRHLLRVIELIERAREEEMRVCLSMPPRHAKTTLLLHAIVWWLECNTADTCGYFSYSDTQGRSKSRLARNLAVKAGLAFAGDSASLSEWRTKTGGGLLAGGVGGGLTGQGVSGLMVVDDPFKNRMEADSETIRENVWNWFTEVVMTRLEGASVFVVQTRWHEDDLIGRLEKEGDWTIVNLAALAEANDELGRTEGEALWPKRYSEEKLAKTRKILGEFSWAALYQGRPRPRGSHVFGPAHYYDPALVDLTGALISIGCDPAAIKKTTADYSVIWAMSVLDFHDPAKMRAYVREVYHEQVEIPTLVSDLRAFQRRHGSAKAYIEAVGAFAAVPQMIRLVDPTALIADAEVLGDKFTRAQPIAAAWNDGRVFLPLGKTEADFPWVKDVLAEFDKFTGVNDATDDIVDGASHAWNSIKPPAVYVSPTVKAPRRM